MNNRLLIKVAYALVAFLLISASISQLYDIIDWWLLSIIKNNKYNPTMNRILNLVWSALSGCIAINSIFVAYDIIKLKKYDKYTARPLIGFGLFAINYNSPNEKIGLLTINLTHDENITTLSVSFF